MHSKSLHLSSTLNPAIAAFSVAIAEAAPQITEFVAANSSGLTDGNQNTSDWIEIHNPDATTLDLSGYRLSDDPANLGLFTFPTGAEIEAGGYLVVFASGRPEPDYVDPEGNLHTNFSLGRNGDYLALSAPDNTIIQEFSPQYPEQFENVSYGLGFPSPVSTPILEGAPSTWLVPTSDIGSTWQEINFDDSSWATANTAIGYGYDDLVGTGGNTRSQMFFGNPSAFLRVPFEINNPSNIDSLELAMRYEDGFVAYLNGTRVASSNAPDETSLEFNSTATAIHPDNQAVIPETFAIPTAPLVAGTNILAIHGLNLTSRGSDSNDFLALPELTTISTGLESITGFFLSPTPGAENTGVPFLGLVDDTKFSVDRGYFTEPFNVAITTDTPESIIYYTTDGTPPSKENGTIYNGEIAITKTTTLRAIATKERFQPTNIDTQTYLFVADIVQQERPTSYPTTWGGAPADYAMDPEVVEDSRYTELFDEAFASFPTLSLVFDPDAFFDSASGIYQNPREEGAEWERPLSAEFFVPDDSEEGFQINAGIRVQGGSSRNPDTPKHSLSLRFRAEYGANTLRYPLFENTPGGAGAIDEFDLLQLRPEYNFGWMHRHWYQARYALYGRDQWTSDMFLAMGQNGTRGRWVHLFLNGIYWGLYDIHERPDADYMASYFGGNPEDYDTINSSLATNGNLAAFNEMTRIVNSTTISQPSGYSAIQEYLDLDAFIDYMILNTFIGNRDWDAHNWRAARKREPGAKFLFFPWDSEFAASHVSGGNFENPPEFFTTALATDITNNNGRNRPTGIQQRLALNPEYRLRYADRIRAHFFDGGTLTSEKAAEAWITRATPMHDAIIAESARWGDFRRDINPSPWASSQFDLFTRDDHYTPTNTWLLDTYIPQRPAIVLDQFRAIDLYPATDAPTFSQHGGTVPRGFSVAINAPDTVFYTTDGSDPRATGGTVAGTATQASPGVALTLNESTRLRARTRASDGEWSALSDTVFTISVTDLSLTEIMYNPATNPLAEFLELTNTGDFEIGLTGLIFTDGIDFDFTDSPIQSLAPGARLLIIRDTAAFRDTYGTDLDSLIAGEFMNETALANGGSETITLSDASGETVFSVTYRDDAPWPESADGNGRSLVFTGGDPSTVKNWRPSAASGGNPGTSDASPFNGGSIIAYALASGPTIALNNAEIQLSYTTNLTADSAEITIEYSEYLESWETITPAIIDQVLEPTDSTRKISFQLPANPKGFARLVISLRSK